MEGKSPFKYNIDAMVARGNTIFGYGWLFNEDSNVKDVHLELKIGSNEVRALPITHGRPRDDVAKVFPRNHRALYSGFIVYGGWNGGMLKEVRLVCAADNGAKLAIPVKLQRLDGKRDAPSHNHSSLLVYKLLLKRFWAILRHGNLKTLLEKTQRYLTRMPSKANNPIEEIASIWKRAGSPTTLLIIDHDLGGGANNFRKKVVEGELEKGHVVILFTYHVLLLQHVVDVYFPKGRRRVTVDIESLLSLPQHVRISKIFYNTGVSFERPETLPVFMTTLTRQYDIPLTVAINDYFVICPSQFLLDHQGRYCDIPSIETCRKCLKQNEHGFISLFVDRDIDLWRRYWGSAIEAASKIICFSPSSARLLQKAYPGIGIQDKLSIRPHQVRPPQRIPHTDINRPLHIGVVGHINFHKGAAIIKALADYIKKSKLDIKITIFGTIEGVCDPSVVRLLGPYKFEDLPDLIEESGANLFFMPSICPETFSYVVHELIDMGVPLACFDLGAQGERVATYEKGLILPIDITAQEIIKQLRDFHHRLKERPEKT